MSATETCDLDGPGVFPLRVERFRPAPRYAFREPPHPGELFYEQMRWGCSEEWRAHGSSDLERLGFAESSCL